MSRRATSRAIGPGLPLNIHVAPMVRLMSSSVEFSVNERLPSCALYKSAGKVDGGVSGDSSKPNPVAVVFGWIGSSRRNVKKYEEIYHSLGIDTITISGEEVKTHVMKPAKSLAVCNSIMDILTDESSDGLAARPLLLSGFSIGGYQVGNMMLTVKARGETEQSRFHDRLACTVFDSIIDYQGVPRGVSASIFPVDSVMQHALQQIIIYGFAAFPGAVEGQKASSDMFWNFPCAAPTLWIYSKDDKLVKAKNMKVVHDYWASKMGVDVSTLVLESSPHVQHLRNEPERYTNAMKEHITKSFAAHYAK